MCDTIPRLVGRDDAVTVTFFCANTQSHKTANLAAGGSVHVFACNNFSLDVLQKNFNYKRKMKGIDGEIALCTKLIVSSPHLIHPILAAFFKSCSNDSQGLCNCTIKISHETSHCPFSSPGKPFHDSRHSSTNRCSRHSSTNRCTTSPPPQAANKICGNCKGRTHRVCLLLPAQ